MRATHSKPCFKRQTTVVRPDSASNPLKAALLNTGLSIAQTVVIAAFGFLLTGRLDRALEERRATLQERQATSESVQKMATLLKDINESASDNDMLQSAFAQLAMYGKDAIFPLFVLAANRSQFEPNNAIAGLRLLAVQHRGDVCNVLLQARKVPTAIHEVRKRSVDELAAQLKCDVQEHRS